MPARSTSREDVSRWMDTLDDVARRRHSVERALARLDASMLSARSAGATWDELAYVTGQTRTTVRRWAADSQAPKLRRLAPLRDSLRQSQLLHDLVDDVDELDDDDAA